MIPPPRPAKCILIVDDDRMIRQLLTIALSRPGFAVLPAANGHEAIAYHERHGDSIDLVPSDVQMPGLDGPQTVAVLKEHDPCLRFCFMTGHSDDYSTAELLLLGAIRVLQKPFGDLPELARTLWQAVSPGKADCIALAAVAAGIGST